MKVKWIAVEAAMQIHADQLAEHGGGIGVRDAGRIEAAMARPQTVASYSADADLERLASAYAHGLSKGHPFVDGNKRTAWVVARTFLLINGFRLTATLDERYEKMYALASGDLTEDEFAEWLRGVTVPTN